MKIREYISQKLRAWNITDAQLEDISSGIDLDEEYTSDNSQVVGKAMISVIEELMLAPYMSNVNENGFSVSWDYSRIGQYYQGIAVDIETSVILFPYELINTPKNIHIL